MDAGQPPGCVASLDTLSSASVLKILYVVFLRRRLLQLPACLDCTAGTAGTSLFSDYW